MTAGAGRIVPRGKFDPGGGESDNTGYAARVAAPTVDFVV